MFKFKIPEKINNKQIMYVISVFVFIFISFGSILYVYNLNKSGKQLKAMVDKKQDADLPFEVAENYLKMQQYDKAKEYFIKTMHSANVDKKAKAYYRLAEIYLYDISPDYKKSLDIYEYALKNYPLQDESEKANFNLGFLYQKLDFIAQAKSQWQLFLALFPDSSNRVLVKLNLSRAINKENKFGEAEIYLKEIVKNEKANMPTENYIETVFELSYSLEKQGKNNEAINNLEILINDFPEDSTLPSVYLKIGEIYENNNDIQKSILLYKKTIENFPDSSVSAEAAFKLIALDYNNKKYIQASENLIGFVDKYPTHPLFKDALFKLIDSLMQLNEINKALPIAEIFKIKFPDDLKIVEIKLLFADYYFKNKSFINAQKEYIVLLRKFPHFEKRDEILFKLGVCFLNLKNFDKANIFFEELCDNYPDSIFVPESIYLQAKYYQNEKDLFRSAYLFEKYYLSSPFASHLDEAKQNAAYCYTKLGLFIKANDIYEEFKKSEKEEIRLEGLKGIADIYFEQQKYGAAKEMYEKLLSYNLSEEQSIEVFVKMIETLIKLGSYKKAVDLCKYYINKYNKNFNFYNELAEVYSKVKKYDVAVEYYEKYSSRIPLDSTNVQNYINFADALYYQKKFNKALLIYDTLKNFSMLPGEKAWVLNQKAYLLMKINNNEESQKTYEYLKANFSNEYWGRLADNALKYVKYNLKGDL